MAQKRTPKVVVFEEPRFETSRKSSRELKKERDKFLVRIETPERLLPPPQCLSQRGDVSDIFSAINSTTSDDKKQEDKPSESGIDLRATLREVESLGKSAHTALRHNPPTEIIKVWSQLLPALTLRRRESLKSSKS